MQIAGRKSREIANTVAGRGHPKPPLPSAFSEGTTQTCRSLPPSVFSNLTSLIGFPYEISGVPLASDASCLPVTSVSVCILVRPPEAFCR